jgi:hypothetical protein
MHESNVCILANERQCFPEWNIAKLTSCRRQVNWYWSLPAVAHRSHEGRRRGEGGARQKYINHLLSQTK